MPKKINPYTIIRDTRENTGWTWEKDEGSKSFIPIDGTKIDTLDAGDYSIEGMQHIVRIERKASISELYGNLMSSEHKQRFYREMEKLKDIKYKCIVIESSISREVFGMSPCNLFSPIPCSKIILELNKIYFDFGVPYHFVGDAGHRFVRMYFDQVVRREQH